MTDHPLIIAADGTISLSSPTAGTAAPPPGGLVMTITDCPSTWGAEDVLALARDCRLPDHRSSVPFEKLLARHRGSCCGGHCG
ncbi:hypothetical protein UCD39_10485 [Nitrospirillum sp. BR 11752]|uniref:hypothetical protein n=1 Tax=Nitrospirillum sp. BR 11752 TaxID=3104293 RepID=UPI002EA0ABB0|nr:hypothetical protein [Nitrospirillum sp. BR 11752]